MAHFTAEKVYRDLFAFVNVSPRVHRMSFDALVPVRLSIFIAGVVDAACFKEDTNFSSPSSKGVRSNNSEKLLGRILVWVHIAHGEDSLPLRFAERVDLLAY